MNRLRPCALVLVVAVYAAGMWAGRRDVPLTDDAEFYLGAAQAYKAWCGRAWESLASGNLEAFRGGVVDRYFSQNWVHPPVAKLVFAAGIAAFHDALGWLDEIEAARVGTLTLSTGLAALLFLICWPTYGPLAAVAAPLCLLAMPRFFFDSHLENLDVPSAATYFLAVYCYWRARSSWRWALAAGVAGGIAMDTKINGALVALPLAAHWVLTERPWRPRDAPRTWTPLALASMVTLGPLVAVALWPWLWTHTAPRLVSYLRFYLDHHPSLFYYRGHVYDVPFAPWHAPFVMAAITTPLPILALALAGAVVAATRPLSAAAAPSGASDEVRRLDLLVLLNAAFTIGAVALPSVPKYGGVKLFLPFFPFLAMLAAVGLDTAARAAAGRARGLRARVAIGGVALAVLVGGMSWTIARLHPYELSYYNALVGGLRGAEEHGFEIQYYDLWYLDLARFLNGRYPAGVRVFFAPNNKEYLRHVDWYYRAGRLSRRVVVVPDESQADLVVLTHEMRWPQYPALLSRLRVLRAVHEIEVEGVPLLTVYEVHHPTGDAAAS